MAGDSVIVVKPSGSEWHGHFEGQPNFALSGENSVQAVRRLLEGMEAEPAMFIILSHGDTGSEVLRYSAMWDGPELLFPCQVCEGRGEYVGLLVRETCHGCGGRKVIPV